MFHKTPLPLFALFGLIGAECLLSNTLTEDQTQPETRSPLCLPQGADAQTFSMGVSMVAVPTLDGENMWAGVHGNQAFVIYDNYCMPRGVYDPGQSSDCGVPYVIKENWLPYVLTVKLENGATWGDLNEGLRVDRGCKSAFPIEGEPEPAWEGIVEGIASWIQSAQ